MAAGVRWLARLAPIIYPFLSAMLIGAILVTLTFRKLLLLLQAPVHFGTLSRFIGLAIGPLVFSLLMSIIDIYKQSSQLAR